MSQSATRPTLIFTASRAVAVAIALFLSVGACTAGRARRRREPGGEPAQEGVRRLGLPGNNNIGDVKDLAKAPYASTGLLISQLHTVKNPQRTVVGYGSAEINHLIWVIAALRYITGGMDFCAPTGWRPGKSQEAHYRSYWLHFADKRCVTFFAVWPSRGRYYFAPLDAQRRIIGAWRRWYAENGKSYNFRPLVNPEPWDWLEGVEKPVLVTGKGR